MTSGKHWVPQSRHPWFPQQATCRALCCWAGRKVKEESMAAFWGHFTQQSSVLKRRASHRTLLPFPQPPHSPFSKSNGMCHFGKHQIPAAAFQQGNEVLDWCFPCTITDSLSTWALTPYDLGRTRWSEPFTGQLTAFGKTKDPKNMRPPLLSSEARRERRE